MHPAFHALVGRSASVRVLSDYTATGQALAHEAGVYDSSTDSVVFTSNLLRDEKGSMPRVEVRSVQLGHGQTTLLDLPDVPLANGACPVGEHHALFCAQGDRERSSSLHLVDLRDPTSSRKVLNNFHGRRFNSLNDVIVLPPPEPREADFPLASSSLHHPQAGASSPWTSLLAPGSTIWFTDPPYGFEQGFKSRPQLPAHVYVWDPFSGDLRVAADGFHHPNGIAFSPDGTVCYVTDTSHIHGTGELDPSLASTMQVVLLLARDHG